MKAVTAIFQMSFDEGHSFEDGFVEILGIVPFENH